MNIAIAGHRGYLGSKIKESLIKQYSIIEINRGELYDDEKLSNKIKDADIVINFTGYSINKKWNRKNKDKIYNSRIITTKNIVNTLNNNKTCKLFINGSATQIKEEKEYFINTLINNWEEEANKTNDNIRTCIIKTGVVIGKDSPFVTMIKKSKIGNICFIPGKGKQKISYIFIDDFIKGIKKIINDQNIEGRINMVSDKTLTYSEIINNVLVNKCLIKINIPKVFIKIILGKRSVIIFKPMNYTPDKLINNGFVFNNK